MAKIDAEKRGGKGVLPSGSEGVKDVDPNLYCLLGHLNLLLEDYPKGM